MNQRDFVVEFEEWHFPKNVGQWIGVDDHDPPWTAGQLRQMARQGLIERSKDGTQYRLTLKATAVRNKTPNSPNSPRTRI